jgi:hypothetical protein
MHASPHGSLINVLLPGQIQDGLQQESLEAEAQGVCRLDLALPCVCSAYTLVPTTARVLYIGSHNYVSAWVETLSYFAILHEEESSWWK